MEVFYHKKYMPSYPANKAPDGNVVATLPSGALFAGLYVFPTSSEKPDFLLDATDLPYSFLLSFSSHHLPL